MMEKKKINVSLFRVVNDIAPFVLVDYLDDNADEHTGAMLLDSASQSNILLSENKSLISYSYGALNDKTKINGIGRESVVADNVKINFTLGDAIFQETFCIAELDLPKSVGNYPLIGLLGNHFLTEHHLVIDYSDFTLHTPVINQETLSVSECEFYFPIGGMVAAYGVPVVPMNLNGQQVAAMADTGSTNNMIAFKTVEEKNVSFKMMEGEDEMNGIGGCVHVKEAVVPFSLISMTSDHDCEKKIDSFKLSPSSHFISARKVTADNETVLLPPVDAILGSPFMARQGWILDFSLGVIYKKKSRFLIDVTGNESDEDEDSIDFYTDTAMSGMPYIMVKEGEFKGMILMLDTGSSVNVLFGSAFNELRDRFELERDTTNLIGLDGIPSEVRKARTSMTFNGNSYEMTFLINENGDAAKQLQEDLGFPVAGTIGTPFMSEHGWMIDFANQRVIVQPQENQRRIA